MVTPQKINKYCNFIFLKKKIIYYFNMLFNYYAKEFRYYIIIVASLIIKKIENFEKSYSKITKETVLSFLKDRKKSKFKL